jgi:peroxiredoxin
MFAGTMLAAKVASAQSRKPRPSDFEFSGLDGTRHAVSQHRGKAVALYFFNPG